MPSESSWALWLSHPFLLAKTGLRLWTCVQAPGRESKQILSHHHCSRDGFRGGSVAKEEDEANQYLAFNKP